MAAVTAAVPVRRLQLLACVCLPRSPPSSEQLVLFLPLQDKEDAEPKTKQFREGEEEGEKHR